ncbi:acyl-CoA thioesterase [Ascidiimonas sp. W6]|uniref:acyl-CoA thioesterase n=1 Tax=Ascidiimonas meishanensis TaxID=3128903 RepID=UPI0030ED9383
MKTSKPKIYKKVEDSQVTISVLMLPSHSNFSGKIHGGYILSLMDQIAFACASKYSGVYCVTASVDTVDFLNPIEIGELVTMKASINFIGNSSMVVGIRVESENIQNGTVKHCNSSYFTMVAKNDLGENVKVPGLIIETEEQIKRFLKSIKRADEKRNRKKAFGYPKTISEASLKTLEQYNIKLALKS